MRFLICSVAQDSLGKLWDVYMCSQIWQACVYVHLLDTQFVSYRKICFDSLFMLSKCLQELVALDPENQSVLPFTHMYTHT